MKKLIIVSALILTGCFAHIEGRSGDMEISYTRIGGQEISGLTLSKVGEDIAVELESLKAETSKETIESAIDVLEAVK